MTLPSIQSQIDAFLHDCDQTEWFKRAVNTNIVSMIREGFVTYLESGDGHRRLRLTDKGHEVFGGRPKTAAQSH